MKRTFIAISVRPEHALTTAIGRIRGLLSSVRITWARPEGLHITLAFTGSTPAADEATIAHTLAAVCLQHAAFSINLKGIGTFGNATPRVLWIGTDDTTGRLNLLANDLRTALAAAGVTFDSQPFNPHLTLGRIKQANSNLLQEVVRGDARTIFQRAPVAEVVFYSSISVPGEPPIYKPIAVFPLNPTT